eukprot:112720-Chlamydomonas_euryale.AAC.1
MPFESKWRATKAAFEAADERVKSLGKAYSEGKVHAQSGKRAVGWTQPWVGEHGGGWRNERVKSLCKAYSEGKVRAQPG